MPLNSGQRQLIIEVITDYARSQVPLSDLGGHYRVLAGMLLAPQDVRKTFIQTALDARKTQKQAIVSGVDAQAVAAKTSAASDIAFLDAIDLLVATDNL